jgi:PAS domain S-box-containing protein
MPLNGDPVHFLIIEDNPADALLRKECISETPIVVASADVATTAQQALSLLKEKTYGIVFIDLSLPDVIHDELLDIIQQISSGGTPVIVVSGMSDLQFALKTITRGAQDYIFKDKLESDLLAKSIYYSIERTNTRVQLQESERRFRYISEHFPNGKVCFLDRNLNFVFGTGGQFKREAIDTNSLPGTKFSAMFSGENQQRIEQKLMRAFEGKDVLFEAKTEKQTFLISAVAAYETSGRTDNIIVVAQNITDFKRAEEHIHFQATVLENIMDSVIVTDLQKNVISWNKSATMIYGYEEHEMLGKNMSLLAVDEKDGTDPENLIRVLNEKKKANITTRRKRKDGTIIWVELKLTYNYNVDNKITGLIGISRDITEQRAEEHLLKLFQSVILNSHDAVVMTEAVPSEGDIRKIVFVNEAFCEITGFHPNEVIGNTFFMLVGPATDKNEIMRIQNNLRRWQSFSSEIALYRKDNSSFWVDATIMPVSDESGNYTHWVWLQRDTTADRESAEKLMQKNEELTKTNLELDRFVYSASHDLRAPLTSVLGLVGLMRRETFAPEAKIYLDKVQESVQRLDRLIQNIINYSRNSRLDLNAEPINFRELFETAVSMHKFMDQAGSIRFDFEDLTNGDFRSDPDRWQIIFNNLISNGIKFARPNSSSFISMKISRRGDDLVAEITDNGIGITADQLKSVFQMFYRATTMSEGSGLGLYIVRQTVELLGGIIEVASESMEFTRFTITVPYPQSEPSAPAYAAKSNLSA